MNPRTVLVALVPAALACLAAPVLAQPDPATSVVPRFMHVIGFQEVAGDVPDTFGGFTVTVNDAGGVPIVGAEVVLDFAACTDMCLCTYTVPGQIVTCDPVSCRGTVSAITGAGGVAVFQVLGAGQMAVVAPPAIAPGPGSGCIAVSAAAPGGPFVALATSTCVHIDINGALPAGGNNGLNGLDLSYVKNDIGAAGLGAPYRGRSDWSNDGVLNAIDLSHWMRNLFRSAGGTGSRGGCSSAGVVNYCP